jgi:hypothetical protein
LAKFSPTNTPLFQNNFPITNYRNSDNLVTNAKTGKPTLY